MSVHRKVRQERRGSAANDNNSQIVGCVVI